MNRRTFLAILGAVVGIAPKAVPAVVDAYTAGPMKWTLDFGVLPRNCPPAKRIGVSLREFYAAEFTTRWEDGPR